MTTYYMQDKNDYYRYTRISKPRAYCEAMEGGYIAEQSYLDSYCKVEYSDNGRVAVIRAY